METSIGYESALEEWIKREEAATSLMNAISNLSLRKSVELVIFRNSLIDKSVSEILQVHQYAKEFVNKPINVYDTAELANIITELSISPSRIDLGRLAYEWLEEKGNYAGKTEFITNKLSEFIDNNDYNLEPRDVVLFGFGRIGRLCAREIIKQTGRGQQLRLRAIVTRKNDDSQISKRASLLRNDSVHGAFSGTVEEDFENKALIINGQIVQMIAASSPEDVDYTSFGINDALLIDNTGVYRDRTELSRHLASKGIGKVILTAPGKEVPNIVYGANHFDLDLDNEKIYSAASCTTNAIVPVLSVIENNLGIEKGHIETVHAYTNDQNLLDNMHSKHRRGRSAAINMVITETGAAKAVVKVIPSLIDKLTANAVRVPTVNGSLAIMNLTVEKETTVEQVKELIKKAALEGDLVEQVKYSFDEDLVSTDIIGSSCCSVYDSPATIVSKDGKNIVLYVWYDNEFGYTLQVIRLAKHVAKVRRLLYY